MDRSAQGGKAFGLLKAQQEEKLESVNQQFLTDPKYADEEDLDVKLDSFKKKYMEFDLNDQGEIEVMSTNLHSAPTGGPKARGVASHLLMNDIIGQAIDFGKPEPKMMGLKRMLEKLGVAKTHLELKKMISEVVGGTSRDSISYTDFVSMMLGKRNAILRLILMFEDMGKDQETKEPGPPPRKTFSDLP